MDCLGLEEFLQYIHAETNPDDTEKYRRHMEQCHTCSQELQKLQDLTTHLARMEWPTIPPKPPVGPCLDTLRLAAYLDQRLAAPERERVTVHLSSCQRCRDEVAVAEHRLTAVMTAPHTTPPGLRAQAIQLGALQRQTAQHGRWAVVEHCERWLAQCLQSLSWRWAVSGLAVAALLMLYVVHDAQRATPAFLRQTTPPPPSYGYGFGTADDVLVAGIVPSAPALQQALLAYQLEPTAVTRTQLLAVLGATPLRLPAERVTTIEMKRSLQELLTASTSLPALQVQLLHDGLLVLGVAP